MKAYRGSRGTPPLITILDEWSAPRPGRFPPGKQRLWPLTWRLGRPQSQSGRLGTEENPLFVQGFETLTVQPFCYRPL
jgi:hypothetical protein